MFGEVAGMNRFVYYAVLECSCSYEVSKCVFEKRLIFLSWAGIVSSEARCGELYFHTGAVREVTYATYYGLL